MCSRYGYNCCYDGRYTGVLARDEFWDGPSHKPLGQSTAPPETHM